MKANILFYLLLAAICGAWIFVLYLMNGEMDFSTVLMGAFLTVPTLVIIYALMALVWRRKNGVDLLATLETDPEKVKSHMLFIMQWGHSGGIVGALKEFNDIFRNYPQWRLQDWEVFRAWYKDQIDFLLEHPDICEMNLKGGKPYSKDEDPLYNPDAKDWELFDRDHTHDFDDDDEDFDDDDYRDKNDSGRSSLKKAAEDGFVMGVGFGIASDIIDHSDISGN